MNNQQNNEQHNEAPRDKCPNLKACGMCILMIFCHVPMMIIEIGGMLIHTGVGGIREVCNLIDECIHHNVENVEDVNVVLAHNLNDDIV